MYWYMYQVCVGMKYRRRHTKNIAPPMLPLSPTIFPSHPLSTSPNLANISQYASLKNILRK